MFMAALPAFSATRMLQRFRVIPFLKTSKQDLFFFKEGLVQLLSVLKGVEERSLHKSVFIFTGVPELQSFRISVQDIRSSG